MKTIFLTTIILLASFPSNNLKAQQILNGGFEENYVDSVFTIGVLRPINWDFGWVPDDCWVPLGSLTDDSNSGDWALKLETIGCGWGNYAGVASTNPEISNPLSYPEAVAHIINDRPDQISLYYKFSPINNDTALVRALLFNYPDTVTFANDWDYLSHIDTIAFLTYNISEASNDYSQLVINFEYESADIPAYISVSIFSDKKTAAIPIILNATPGTTLWVDDVELIYLSTSVENLITANDVKLFPNPVADNFRVEVPGNEEIQSITVIDYSGRVVKNLVLRNGMYSINGLATGMYFVQIETDKGKVVKKVMKE
jgi:hypothetical protein